MTDFYLKTWSNSLSAEAQDAGESATAQYTIAFTDAAFAAGLPQTGDRIHFAQGSGNKKPFLENCSQLIAAAVTGTPTFTLAYGDTLPTAAGTNEQIFLTGAAFTTGTALRQVPVSSTIGVSPTDYIANDAVVASDTGKDYYVKVSGNAVSTGAGSVIVTLSVVPNTGFAPQQ
jgi:hypothetical protein